MKKTVTWILIADGAQARVLENTGPGKGFTQVENLAFTMENLRASDVDSNNGGSTETSQNPVEQRETDFVKNVAEVLEKERQKGAFERLVIAAAPVALGDLRKAISPHVKKLVIAEVNKDLTNLPTAQLGEHLDGIIAV